MSLGLVFGATNELLVLADGRNSRRASSGGPLVPLDDENTKLVPGRGVPIVVVATGKSHMFKADGSRLAVADWVAEHLEERAASGPASAETVQSVGKSLVAFLDEALRGDRDFRLGQEDVPLGPVDLLDELELLVAGYSPGLDRPEVWTLTVTHEHCTEGPDPGFDARPMASIPHRPTAHVGSDENVGMPADLVEAYFDHSGQLLDDDKFEVDYAALDGAYQLRDLRLEDVRREVPTGIRDLIAQDRRPFDEYGVGGIWTVIEVRSGQQPKTSRVCLGPCMPT